MPHRYRPSMQNAAANRSYEFSNSEKLSKHSAPERSDSSVRNPPATHSGLSNSRCIQVRFAFRFALRMLLCSLLFLSFIFFPCKSFAFFPYDSNLKGRPRTGQNQTRTAINVILSPHIAQNKFPEAESKNQFRWNRSLARF